MRPPTALFFLLLTLLLAPPALALDLNTQEIRGPGGILLGKIVTTSAARIEARSPFGNLVGYYDVKTNETRDAKGAVIGKGNMLTGLLTK